MNGRTATRPAGADDPADARSHPPLAASARIPPQRVLVVAAFGAFLAFLDATIVNVAFPSMRASFADSSVAGLSWVLNAYNIVFAACLILCGRLTDVIGRRRSYVAGVVLFTVASVLCGLAPTVELLVAFRVVQGFGAALLVPASLALVIAAFPPERRSHAIGLWGAAAAVAAGLGPPLGGALVELGDWRWTFLINLPLGLLALVAARRQLVESRAPGSRRLPDLLGAGLLAAGLALLNLAIVKGNDWGWTSTSTAASFAGAAVLLVLFVLSSRRHRVPILDPALLRLPSFAVGSLATVVAGFGFYAYLLTNILWLQYVWGYSVLEAGLATAPAALIAAVVAARLGPLTDRLPYRWFVVPGAVVWASAYVWYHQQVGLSPDFLGAWLPGQVLSGIGVGATLPLLGSAALSAVPGGRYATASAVVSAARQLGGVLGIAVLVVILGEPTPSTVVESLRDGWMLSIAAFAVVAAVAALLGRSQSSAADEEEDDDGAPASARILAPHARASGASGSTSPNGGASLSDAAIFGALPPPALARLDAASTVVEVPAGTALMEAGDPAGSAYVVRTGRLEVEVGGVRVREVGPGDVLGEIALITGEPRSATIRAVRDSSLLEVPRDAFTELLRTDQTAAVHVLEQVAERLRTLRSAPVPPTPETVTVVSVVGMGARAPVEEVAAQLVEHLGRSLRVAAPGRIDPESLVRAEQDNDRVVLVADERDPQWRSFCLRQADTVVLVAHADSPPPRSLDPRPARRPEVVLVGPPPSTAVRTEWAAAADAWQLTLVPESGVRAGLRDLGDRLGGTALGVVLAGGGARSLTGIGVLRELEDAGLRVSRVAGASMGAIVAATHALGLDGAGLEDAAYAGLVLDRPFGDYAISSASLVRGERVRSLLGRTFGRDTVVEGLPRQLAVVSTDLLSRTRQVHRRGNLVEAVAASARLPVLFPPIPTDDGRLLVDGGVIDNMPTDLLLERAEGPVVAVAIGPGTERARRPGRPRVPAMPDTLMRTLMMQSGGVVETARELGAWVVAPPSLGVGLLEFHQFDRLVGAGRQAARDLLEQTGGDLRL